VVVVNIEPEIKAPSSLSGWADPFKDISVPLFLNLPTFHPLAGR
jgi:hypothetical protein